MRALLLVLLVAACQKDAGPKIALRYHPPTGAVYRYALEQNTRLDMPSASGPLAGVSRQQMQLRIYSTQTVKGPVDGGGIEVQIVMDSASLAMPNVDMSRQLAQLRGSRSTAVFDDRFHMLRSDVRALEAAPPEVANQMAAVLNGMAYAFPAQPVGPGDSWTVSMKLPIEQFGGVDASQAGNAQTTLTVREIQVRDTDTSVVLDIKTAFPTGPVQLAIAGQRGSMTLSGEMTGQQTYSISRGTVVDATIGGETTIKMTIPTLGIREMALNTVTSSTLQLTGAP
jgi:hypothetical protein